MLALVIQNQPHRAGPDLVGKLVRRLAHDGSSFSRIGASANPGAVHYRWPGPVHEGHGTWWSIVDRKATPDQVDALFKILGGKEQEPTTGFAIYASTIEHEPDPMFADIEFEWDLKGRKGRFVVRNVLGAEIEPIQNPVTGKPHFISIRPHDDVAHDLHDTAAMHRHQGIEDGLPPLLQRRQCARLVLLHEPAVANPVGGKATLGPFFGHVLPLRQGAAA